jgi:hypothetical protein
MTKAQTKPSAGQPTTAELAADFERQRQEQRTVTVLLSSRAEERKKLLLTGTDADVIEHDRRTVTLELRRDRAAARIDAIRRDHQAAIGPELEMAKTAMRADAETQRKAGTAAYLRAEENLKKVFADLAIVSAADQAIANANANPVNDATSLLPCEADYRWVDGVPDRTETVSRRAPKISAVLRPGTSRADEGDEVEMTTRIIHGRAAVRPPALYNELEAPALRPGDAPLRVPGTSASPFHTVPVKKLKPTAALPADDAAAANPTAAKPAAQDGESGALRVAGFNR